MIMIFHVPFVHQTSARLIVAVILLWGLSVVAESAEMGGGACVGPQTAPAEGDGAVLACLSAVVPGTRPPVQAWVTASSPDRLMVGVAQGPGGVWQEAEAEALTVDPLNTPTLALVPDRWLGGRGVAVVVSNAFVGSGRSMATRSLHLFRRSGERLEFVFATFLQADHSGWFGCRGGRDGLCRLAWSRRFELVAGPVATGQSLPTLTVRNAHTGRTVAVRRPVGGRYSPDRYDELPPFAPP